MHRQQSEHEKIIHRLKISSGHLKKIIEMVENDEYCIDIVHQSKAVQKALHEVDLLLVEEFITKNLKNNMLNKSPYVALGQVMQIIKKGS